MNVELLERVMRHIERHPEQHDQGEWVTDTDCGTAACFAGWAAILTYGEEIIDLDTGSWLIPGASGPMTHQAGSLLGLNPVESLILFHAGNEVETLRAMVDNLKAGRSILDGIDDPYLDELCRSTYQ